MDRVDINDYVSRRPKWVIQFTNYKKPLEIPLDDKYEPKPFLEEIFCTDEDSTKEKIIKDKRDLLESKSTTKQGENFYCQYRYSDNEYDYVTVIIVYLYGNFHKGE